MRSYKNRKASAFVLLLALLCGLAASWAWSGRVRSAQQVERGDLNLFLDASSAGWATVTDQFFAVPETAAQSVAALLESMESVEERQILLAETIRTSQVLDAAFVGYPNGEFHFVGRSDGAAPEGFRTRTISGEGEDREVLVSALSSDRTELSSEVDPVDAFDPRARPWYLTDDSLTTSWTAPYIFASSEQPGITYSTRIVDENGDLRAVVGIDIRLRDLAGFLDRLAPGANGDAVVVDAEGNVIAASAMSAQPILENDASALLPDAQRALYVDAIDRLTTQGTELDRTPTEDGFGTTVVRPVRGLNDWYLVVEARDADFLGDFSNAAVRNLFGIIAIGLASAIIVGRSGYWLAAYQRRLKSEAELDELTGLLSRRAVRRALETELSDAETPLAVAIIDLDGFKAVNDTHGHVVGDKVLTVMAQRIDTFAVASNAISGRLGGDEFAVVGPTPIDWEALAQHLAETLTVDNIKFDLTASIGVANVMAGDDHSVEDILGRADREMFAVKHRGGHGSRVDAGTDRGGNAASIAAKP